MERRAPSRQSPRPPAWPSSPTAAATPPYGQHACYALPAIPWAECYTSTPPGVPLEEDVTIPGTPVAVNGRLTPSDAPGFGVELDPAKFMAMAG